MTTTLKGNVLTENGFIEGEIIFDEIITSINGHKTSLLNKNLPIIIPGFIDLHVHGAMGADFMDGGNAFHKISQSLYKFGTTSFLATTLTAEKDKIKNALSEIKNLSQSQKNGSKCLGIHLEGPYINQKNKGAHEEKMREATESEILEYDSIFPLKVITISPELFSHTELIKKYQNQFVFQLGHTSATYEQSLKAFNSGIKSVTHLFNAMSALHHREPGAVGASLLHAEYAEIIPDLLHVHPAAIKLALKNIPNIYFVTDSSSATGMPDGDYKLGELNIRKCQNGVRLHDGTLAGSSLTMIEAFKNAISLGLSIEEASKRLSEIPARLIKEELRGKISNNCYADLLVLNHDYNIENCYIEGQLHEK